MWSVNSKYTHTHTQKGGSKNGNNDDPIYKDRDLEFDRARNTGKQKRAS